MNGEEAFRALRQIQQDVTVVLSSGYSEQEVTERFTETELSGFIQKPYRLEEMKKTLRRVLGNGES